MAASSQGPVVFYGLSPDQAEEFAAHEAVPQLILKAEDQPVWAPPPEAEAIFCFAKAWKGAPATAPIGWPYNIRYIQMASAGADAVPEWAWGGGVQVACARGVTAEPIAEYVIAAILRDSKAFETMVVRSLAEFRAVGDETAWGQQTLRAIKGQTLGLVGYGAIGQAIATRARALGMKVRALRRSTGGDPEIFVTDINALVAESDQIVLCAPATPETRHIMNAAVMAHAKPGAHLINIARGGLLDHDALAAALDAGQIRHATLDVTEPEPLPEGHAFYSDPRVTLTPHAAWFSLDHHQRLTRKLLDNLGRFARGEPLADLVEAGKGY